MVMIVTVVPELFKLCLKVTISSLDTGALFD